MATSLMDKINRARRMKSPPKALQAAMQQPSTAPRAPRQKTSANQSNLARAQQRNAVAPVQKQTPSIPAGGVGAMQASMASKKGPVMTQQQQYEANRKPLTQQQMMAKGGAVKKKKVKK